MRSVPWLLLAFAALVRVYGCAITPVPGRDGVAYLWMAEQFASDSGAALVGTVFHPLYPALIGLCLMLAPGLDATSAGQIIAAGAGALAVVPLWATARAVCGERAAVWTGFLYVIGVWFTRHPAECMSEGTFYLLAALWAWALTARPRTSLPAAAAGIAAGLAFLTRPEGAALGATGVVFLLAAGARRAALSHATAAVAVAAVLPIAMMATGHGFSLTPKAAFNWDVGAGSSESAISWYFAQWLRWPGDAWEGLGYLVFPLIVIGAVRHRPRTLADPRLCLLLPFVAQVVVVPLLKSHHRFASGLGILLLPFAGAALVELCRSLRQRWRGWPVVVLLLLVASEAKLFVGRPADRTIERDLGRWLQRERPPEVTIASDMPRLVYFAGLPPPPPRRISAAELLAWAGEATCRFVVLKKGRTAMDHEALQRLGYRPSELPANLAKHPHGDQIELLQR